LVHGKTSNSFSRWGSRCRGQPEGPLKQLGKSRLKPAKRTKAKCILLKRTHGHSPCYGGPRGPPRRPTQRSPRAGSAPLEGARLPRAGSASLEGAPHAHARSRTRVWAFNALMTAGRRHHAPGTHAPALLHQLPRGNPSPPLWGTVRHGRCQPRDAAPPTPVRLTGRALEGGPATPSKRFPVTLQGQVVTLGRRDAIPATVKCRRPPLCVQHHAEHCGNSSGAVRHAGTGRRHCIPYGSSSATPSSPPGDITTNHCAPTLEATIVRV
jgi:hypothetical protein